MSFSPSLSAECIPMFWQKSKCRGTSHIMSKLGKAKANKEFGLKNEKRNKPRWRSPTFKKRHSLFYYNKGHCAWCSYNPGQNLLRQIAKLPIFSCDPGKNWNLRQMNARFPPSPYPKLFRMAWQWYTLVFRPRQLWIGDGEGVYFLGLGETGVGRKS